MEAAKKAAVIRSLPSGKKTYTFGSKAACFEIFDHLSFEVVFFTKIISKKTKRKHQQTNRGF